jgi:hypothetical protein
MEQFANSIIKMNKNSFAQVHTFPQGSYTLFFIQNAISL